MATPQHLPTNASSEKAGAAASVNTAATDASASIISTNTNSNNTNSNTNSSSIKSPANPAAVGAPSSATLDKDPFFSYNALDESMNDADLQALRAAEDGDEDFPSLFWDYMDDSNINLGNTLYANGVIDAALNVNGAPPLQVAPNGGGAAEPSSSTPASAGPATSGINSTAAPQGTIRYETSLVQNPLQPNINATAPPLFIPNGHANGVGVGAGVGSVGTPITAAPASLGANLNGGVNVNAVNGGGPAINFDFSAPGFLAELAQQIAANGANANANQNVNVNANLAANAPPVQQASAVSFLPNVGVGVGVGANSGVGANMGLVNVGNVGNVGGVNNYPFLLPSMVNLSNGIPNGGTPVAAATGASSGAPANAPPGSESASAATANANAASTSAPASSPYSSSPVLLSNVWSAAAPAAPTTSTSSQGQGQGQGQATSQQPQPQTLAAVHKSAPSLQAASTSTTSMNRSLSNPATPGPGPGPISLPQPNAQFFGLPPPPSTLGIQAIPPGISLTTQQAQQLQAQATQQNIFLQQIQQAQQQQQQQSQSQPQSQPQQQAQQQQQQIRQQFDSLMSLGNLATTGAMLPPQQQIQMRTLSNAAQSNPGAPVPSPAPATSGQAVVTGIYSSQILPMPKGAGAVGAGATQAQVIPQTPTSTDRSVLTHAGQVSQVSQHNDSSSTNPGSSGANAPTSSSTVNANANANLRRPPLAPNTTVSGSRKRSVARPITNILPATNFVSSSDTDESHTTKGAGTGGKKRKIVAKARKGSDVSIVPSVPTTSNGLGGGLGMNITVPMGLTVSSMPFGSLTPAVPLGSPAANRNGMMPTNITSMSNITTGANSRVTSGAAGKKKKGNSGTAKAALKDGEESTDGAELEMTEEERQLANRLRNREHARNTRARKKAYLETLKSTLEELCQERDTDASERARAASLLLEMQKTRTNVLLHFFALRANNETRRQLWASILEESVTTVMPVTPYRSFPASEVQVSKCQRTVMGVDGMIGDAASLHVLLNSLVDRSRFPEGKIKFQYTLVAEEAVVSGNQMMARWSMTTINARSLGSRREVSKMGMLCARFSSAHKIVSLEIMFDVMAFMLQLKQGTNLQSFTVVPNTVQTCHGPFGDAAMVMTLAERPYTIVQVNSQWEKMTGWKAEDVVGKTSCKILHGEKTEKNALEDLMGSIRYKRPSFTVLTNYTRGHDRSFRNFLTLYPLSTDSKITHYVGLTTHKTWLDGGPNNVERTKDLPVKVDENDALSTSVPQNPNPRSCKAKPEENCIEGNSIG